MELGNLNMALSTLTAYDASSSVGTNSLAYAVGTEMLGKTLDAAQGMGVSMIQMMERSVTPELGGNIDVYA